MVMTILATFMAHEFAYGQETAKFFTENGTKEVTSCDCEDLENLKVKYDLPANSFEYDEIYFVIELTLGDKEFDKYLYVDTYINKKYNLSFKGQSEAEFWVANPTDGMGDFHYQQDIVRPYYLCGSSKNQQITVQAWMTGYVQTGTRDVWSDYYQRWDTYPVYDEGTHLYKSDLVAVAQTAKNIKSFKRKRLLGIF
jgi:hypothetical protein